ncbi:MAG: NAD(P)-dependent alcohol dehydrogenase, partial [Solirubrobacterales bacterium]|nr:NAD(P)-dependent alcohol dehydrogenase [Solirubrobacterales bacterium]
MRAASYEEYGPPEVVHITELPAPDPGKGEVLVRVKSTAVTVADARIRAARFPIGFVVPARLTFGLRRPRRHVLGSSFSGTVESVGSEVEGFAPGDEVCGMNGIRMGAHAEQVSVPAKNLVRKPSSVLHADAAGILFGGTTALYFLRDLGQLEPGQSVLVNGASGSVGTAAVQLALRLGGKVTAVTSSRNLELVTGLGAEQVIDYSQTPVTGIEDQFDVVLDTVGTLDRKSGLKLVREGGVLLLVVATFRETVRPNGKVKSGTTPEHPDDFLYLVELLEQGAIRNVGDELEGLEQIVAAHAKVDSG